MNWNGMKEKMRRWLPGLLSVVLFGIIAVGCNSDDPITPVKEYGSSNVTFLHANPGREGEVAFFRGDVTRIGTQSPSYGNTLKANVPNGESLNYSVKSISGQLLTSTTGGHDSSQYAMVVYAGDAITEEAFIVATKKISVSAGNVAVRFIHAAKDAGTRSLHINDSTGAVIAQDIAYKSGSTTYISVPTLGTTSFWIVDPAKSTPAIQVPVNLAFGTVWTIAFLGSKSALDPALAWKGMPIADE